jgi:hypothetical protein
MPHNNVSMPMEEAQPLGTGAVNRQERMINADFIPALRWHVPILNDRTLRESRGRRQPFAVPMDTRVRPAALKTLTAKHQ